MSNKMKDVIRAILYWNGLAEVFDEAYDFHVRLENDPWLPLVVERHSDEISVTHFVEQNGDQLRDPEMVFSRAEWGRITGSAFGAWVPKSTEPGGLGRAYPTGEIVRREGEPTRLAYSPQRMKEALSFAAMWARNLKAQGFVRRYTAREIQSLTHPDVLQAALAQEQPPIHIIHQVSAATDGTPIHTYDFAEDLPRSLRKWAYRQARAALRRDFPDAEGKYPVGVHGLGYTLHLAPLPDCTCSRPPASLGVPGTQ